MPFLRRRRLGWAWWIPVVATLFAFGVWLVPVVDGLRIRRRLGWSPVRGRPRERP
jgi:hypothetical protein